MLNDHIGSKIKGSSLHTEIRAQVNTNRSVGLLCGNLVRNSRSRSEGVCARVYKNGVYGFSASGEYSPDAVAQVLAAAHDNAVFMDKRASKGEKAFPAALEGSVVSAKEINDAEQRAYIEFARELDDYIAKKCPALVSRSISVRDEAIEKLLRVSDGCDSHGLLPRSFVYISMTANTPDGTPVDLFEPIGGYGDFTCNFSDPALLFGKVDALYEQIMQKREGIYADAGLRDVVMGPDLAGILAHEAVGHTVEADLVLGGSVAAHSLGKQVASELVTMIDYAHTALGKPVPLPVYVDDEGTKAEDAVLIKDGILTGYMNSRETAEHFGMKPQGNARGYGYSDEPLIRMRNTAILPGTSKLADMISAVDDGYYLTATNNGQADTTGEFMFGVCMGYEIKKGKLGKAILDTTISGVAFDMLKTVDMLSDDMVWACNGTCGKKQPMPVGMGGPAIKCKVMMGGR
ncbi:MAG: TldD/PmbA family protein [Ruminococcaceae bacterium]|nr:TldD/PmbA family protein [Oscillospiraceae bacterium]